MLPRRWWHFAGLGLGLALIQAPIGLALLMLPVLALALSGAAHAPSPRRAALWGWALGAGYFGLALIWIIEPMLVDAASTGWLAPFAVIGMGGGLALFWGLAFWAGRRFGGPLAVWALALALMLAEAARAFVLTGFPWADFAQAAMDTPLAFTLPWLGPRGTSGLVIAAAAGLGWLMTRQAQAALAAAFALGIALQVLPGPGPVPPEPDAPIIRLVQPNAPQHLKWDPAHGPEFHRRLLAGTKAGEPPDLIIWPEMALTALLENADETLGPISSAARGAPVILGAPRSEGQTYYNSLAVIGAGARLLALYDKSHLVPFGEYMPLGGLLERLGIYGLASGGQGYGAGKGRPVFDIQGIGLIRPLICYEGIFAEEVRQSPSRPRLLVLITNDAWFGGWIGPEQHLVQGRMRALELGLPMARAANTGISAMIDSHGIVTASLPMDVYGQIDESLPRALEPTLYARAGEIPFLLLYALALAAWLFFVIKWRAKCPEGPIDKVR